jgi:ABC-type sugar transport system ATPase subunit
MSDLRCVAAVSAWAGPIDLEVPAHETVALVGPAGAGKTVVLRMIAGIEPVTSGRIEIDGADVTGAHPAQRGVAVVYANSAPSPRLTIADHLDLVGDRGVAALVGLDGLDRRIKTLSVFERQLVALARALAVLPGVLLLDAPTDGLDPADARELRRRVRALGITTVYATRDAVEAAVVADRVAVLAAGRIAEVASGHTLRAEPNTLAAAVEFDPALLVRTVPTAALPFPAPADPVTLAIRPSALRIAASGGLPGRALAADGATVYVEAPALGEPVPVRVDGPGIDYVGHRVQLAVDPAGVSFFDARTGARIVVR